MNDPLFPDRLRVKSPAELYSQPRDMTGTAAHEKLRDYCRDGGGHPAPVGRPRRPDVATALTRSIVHRVAARFEQQRPAAIEAHARRMAGATWRDLTKEFHMTKSTLLRHWREEGLEVK